MADLRLFASTGNMIRFPLKNSSTGDPFTGLTHQTSGLMISTLCDNERSGVYYTGPSIETIATLGTYTTPVSGIRIKEIDSTFHKGLYELQGGDARFAVTGAQRLIISVTGPVNLFTTDYEVQLTRTDPYNAYDILTKDMGAISGESPRSVLNAMRFIRNKWDVVSGYLRVMKENDSTVAWSGALTTDAAAIPVIGNDPT